MNVLVYASMLFFSALSLPIYAEYHSIKTTMHWENQGNNKSFKQPQSYHHNNHDTWNNTQTGSAYTQHYHFNTYNAQDFHDHFTNCGYIEKEVLQQRSLYMFDEFVKFAQTYSSYQCTIQQLHTELKNLNIVQKACYIIKGTYCPGLQKRIHYLYNQLSTLKNEVPTYQQPVTKEHSLETFPVHQAEYKELGDIYRVHTTSLANAIDKRVDAFNDMSKGDYALQYVSKSYSLNNNVKYLLDKHGYDTASFTQCYGHQLHQALHQESLHLLDRIDSLPATSVLYDHQEALIDFTVAMVDYNHEGDTNKAMQIGDLCWTLFDYGQAIVEGATLGAYCAVTDILTNPIEATINIIAGKHILAFQLSKVLYNVAEIGVTALTDTTQAKDKWNKYAEPLNNIINAINKKEITLRDAIKSGTALFVGYKTQSKLLGGLGKFCNTIKQKSISFVKNNSLCNPQEYCATPEGLLFKATAQSNKLQSSGSSIKKEINLDKKISPTNLHGIYEDAAYHSVKGNNVKSARPIDGQHALNNSLKIETKSGVTRRRIAISNGEFVVLDQTTPDKFHGHVREWDQLSDDMQKTLRKSGLVTNSGKIKQ